MWLVQTLQGLWNAGNYMARLFVPVFFAWCLSTFVVSCVIAVDWVTIVFTTVSAVAFVIFAVWFGDPIAMAGAAISFTRATRMVWTLFWLNLLQGACSVILPVGFNWQTRMLGMATIFLLAIVVAARGVVREWWAKAIVFALVTVACWFSFMICWQAWMPEIAYATERSSERATDRATQGIRKDEGVIPSTLRSRWEHWWGKPKPKPAVKVAIQTTPPAPAAQPAPVTTQTPRKKARSKPVAAAPQQAPQEPVQETAVASMVSFVASPPPPPKRVKITDLPTLQAAVIGDFEVGLKRARRVGTSVVVEMAITNALDDYTMLRFGSGASGTFGYLRDDDDNAIESPSGGRVGNTKGYCYVEKQMSPNAVTSATITFDRVPKDLERTTLQIFFAGGLPDWSSVVTFQDVAIE